MPAWLKLSLIWIRRLCWCMMLKFSTAGSPASQINHQLERNFRKARGPECADSFQGLFHTFDLKMYGRFGSSRFPVRKAVFDLNVSADTWEPLQHLTLKFGIQLLQFEGRYIQWSALSITCSILRINLKEFVQGLFGTLGYMICRIIPRWISWLMNIWLN